MHCKAEWLLKRHRPPADNLSIISSPDYQAEGFFLIQTGLLSRIPKFEISTMFPSKKFSETTRK
jgi:hypothetical protein